MRLLAEYTGRGPTKARTYINDDYIAVVLQDNRTDPDIAVECFVLTPQDGSSLPAG